MSKNFLLIGAGSIGQRHSTNLKNLGHNIKAVVDPQRFESTSNFQTSNYYSTLENSLYDKYDAVLICSPNNLHLKHAIECASKGLPLFIEKPVILDADNPDELLEEVNRQTLPTFVGCNMRFTKGFMRIEEILQSNRLGRVVQVIAHTGSYLPNWRKTDYRLNYAAKKASGGGVLLDAIHEIDYVRAMLGMPYYVSCVAGKFGDLEIETEDIAQIVQQYPNGALSSIHLDYLDRHYTRWCKIICAKGSLCWDFVKGTIEVDDEYSNIILDVNEDRNMAYIREMEHFINVLDGKEKSICPLTAGIDSVKIVEKAKESARQDGKSVDIGKVCL